MIANSGKITQKLSSYCVVKLVVMKDTAIIADTPRYLQEMACKLVISVVNTHASTIYGGHYRKGKVIKTKKLSYIMAGY